MINLDNPDCVRHTKRKIDKNVLIFLTMNYVKSSKMNLVTELNLVQFWTCERITSVPVEIETSDNPGKLHVC